METNNKEKNSRKYQSVLFEGSSLKKKAGFFSLIQGEREVDPAGDLSGKEVLRLNLYFRRGRLHGGSALRDVIEKAKKKIEDDSSHGKAE